MDQQRKTLPLKIIFGIVAMFIVFAFSLAITGTTSAQQAATETPTATPTETLMPGATESPAATSTPEAGATQAPATGATSTPGTTGSTGNIPVTGANQASSNARALAFSRAANRLSNVSDTNLENLYGELLARLHKEERMLNSATNKFNQFNRQLGPNAFNFNNSAQNGLTASERRNRRIQAVQKDFLAFSRNIAVARQQIFLAQSALSSRASFTSEGSLASRQAAINALALAQVSLDRGMAALRQITDIAEAR
jgi:hypothetical protein